MNKKHAVRVTDCGGGRRVVTLGSLHLDFFVVASDLEANPFVDHVVFLNQNRVHLPDGAMMRCRESFLLPGDGVIHLLIQEEHEDARDGEGRENEPEPNRVLIFEKTSFLLFEEFRKRLLL